MSLATLIGIDQERYDQGNKFLSQDPYLQNYQAKAPITFNMSSPVNTGIMGPKIFPYPIIPQDGGDGGGGIINTKDPYGYTGPGSSKSIGGFDIDVIGEGTIDEEDIITGRPLSKMDLAKAAASYLFTGPFGAAGSLFRSSNKYEQMEKDRLQEEIDRTYGKRREDFADIRGGSAPGGGTWSGGGEAAYSNPSTGIGGGEFTDALGNTDYQDAYDPGGGEKDGGFIDGTNRRMDFSNGGLSKYEIFKLGELGYDTKGGTVLAPFGGIKVLRNILKVNQYADGGIVGLYR